MATKPAFQIEKGAPAPKPRVRYTSYPFPDMQVGDSFVVPCSDAEKRETQSRVVGAAWRWSRRNGGKFTSRGVNGGVRIWRIV